MDLEGLVSTGLIRAFVENSVDPPVRGYLHTPESSNGNGLVLTHGAGSNAEAPLLVALAETFCAAGFSVLRCDLAYRQTRSFGPPSPAGAARDRAGLKNALVALEKELGAPRLAASHPKSSSRIILGGHSYGGRQSSMLCAEEPDLVSALLLLSYPLHPPRKPEQQRTQHLPDLRTPTLFVSGTRDPFGSIDELERAIKMIPGKTRLLAIVGAGHDLGFKGKSGNKDLLSNILMAFQELSSAK